MITSLSLSLVGALKSVPKELTEAKNIDFGVLESWDRGMSGWAWI